MKCVRLSYKFRRIDLGGYSFACGERISLSANFALAKYSGAKERGRTVVNLLERECKRR